MKSAYGDEERMLATQLLLRELRIHHSRIKQSRSELLERQGDVLFIEDRCNKELLHIKRLTKKPSCDPYNAANAYRIKQTQVYEGFSV